jgi:hypothetical protein
MLGAGASLSSGVKPTNAIIEELLGKFGSDITGDTPRDRFNKLWSRTSPEMRETFLQPYLDQRPSSGYRQLAELTRAGFFDVIITFNFDSLLQEAFADAGLREREDFLVIVRGDHTDDTVVSMMDRRDPPVKILKLHGSLSGGNTFLFSDDEMVTYPETIDKLVKKISRNPMIVCGYAFNDVCVMRAFSEQGDAIYCVNPGGVPPFLKGFQISRKSDSFVVDKQDGYFDAFFEQLHKSLVGQPQQTPAPALKVNPFKYLASYDFEDEGNFHGRDKDIADLTAKLSAKSLRTVFIVGPQKAGKTSLVRAGLIGALRKADLAPIYLRCRGDLKSTLVSQLQPQLQLPPEPLPLETLFEHLTKGSKHIVLVLDQFERALAGKTDTAKLEQSIRALHELPCSNLTVVYIIPQDSKFMPLILAFRDKADTHLVGEMAGDQLPVVVQKMASTAGITFEPGILEELRKEYDSTRGSEHPFSLTHVHAVCNVLFGCSRIDLERYQDVVNSQRMILDLAINRCDIVNFIEDIPRAEARALLRDIIRLVSHSECNEKIVNYVKQHVSGLFPPAAEDAPASALKQ